MALKESKTETSVAKRLANWQQGDFALNCGEFFFRDVTEPNDEAGDVFAEEVLGLTVISQTCDILRDPERTPVKYATVCPLVKINKAGLSQVGKGQAPRYGLIANAPEGVVVDFSRTMSVSKALLVGWERNRGCQTEKEQLEFSRSLERFFGRFAFPDAFNESVHSLRSAITKRYQKESGFGKAVRSIQELRVFPYGNWNDSEDVSISFVVVLKEENEREVVCLEEISREIKAKIDEIKWVEPFRSHEHGIRLATLSDLTATEYVNSYPLDLNALSFARRFQKEP